MTYTEAQIEAAADEREAMIVAFETAKRSARESMRHDPHVWYEALEEALDKVLPEVWRAALAAAEEAGIVTTVEELEALPVGSVIYVARTNTVWQKVDPDEDEFSWLGTRGEGRYESQTFERLGNLPARILYLPVEGGEG